MSKFNIDEEWNFYYPKVYGYFFRRLSNRLDVEDLTSVVLERFLQTLLDEVKATKINNKNAYLWKIAHNHLVDFIKNKSKKSIPIGLDDNFEVVDESIEKLESQSYQEKVAHLMNCISNQLKDLEYKIVVMSILENKNSIELATELEMSAVNVRQKLSRSLKKLKQKCQEVWIN